MSGKIFLDTNVIVYLYSEDEGDKRDTVFEFVNNNVCITSTQTLNEASNVWLRKHGLNTAQVSKYLDEIEAVCDDIVLIQKKTINKALQIKARFGYSYYDCLILASALENGCDIVLTEDMQDGQFVDTVKS